ncbi:MAG: DNA mismatch repair endonuclease MutL [Planctomycetes bacterium]|nr:DNA mismatch repair endonuclease MutL [Planctomycetota bacterium]
MKRVLDGSARRRYHGGVPSIHVLSQTVVNLIAAGEVLERPASAVKELVENALDSGATRVEVEFEDGGRRLIRVTDDGAGMGTDDLALAFVPHATSKLASAADLAEIRSFGFRGEALASIAEVARGRIVSRPRGTALAHEVEAEGGKIGPVKPSAGPEGTTVEAWDLFGNIPARRKFLKTSPVEAAHIGDVVTRFALARPDVRFELRGDSIPIATLPPVEDIAERIGHYFGKELRQALVPVQAEARGLRLRGYVGRPTFTVNNTRLQFTWVNGRWVRDKVLFRAIIEAYADLVMVRRAPAVFLFLDIEPKDIDVNVHPAKIEIRFANGSRVHDFVRDEIRAKLMVGGVPPQFVPRDAWSSFVTRSQDERKDDRQKELMEFFTRPANTPVFYTPPPGKSAMAEPRDVPPGVPDPTPPMRPIASGGRAYQMHDAYIVEEVPGGFNLIDQHALHERILYYKIRARVLSHDVTRQRLLVPAIVRDSGREKVVAAARPMLDKLGFEVEEFGPGALAIHATPDWIGSKDPAGVVRDILSDFDSATPGRAAEDALDHFIATCACKAAIKAGERLAPEEVHALLEERARIDHSQTCPHGRPVTLRISLEELEKHFGRK